jgi:hypothetical protein
MPSSIIPLVTPADRALAQEVCALVISRLFGEISKAKLRKALEVRLATHRITGGNPDPIPPLPPAKGRGKVPPPYHWRKCE